MILVVGASGNLGMEIVRRLRARGEAVRGLVRGVTDPAKIGTLQGLGVETVTGDLRDPSSLAPACKGVETVISTATAVGSRHGDTIPDVDLRGQASLIDAAKKAGVHHFIYISYSKHIDIGCALGNAKRSTEAHLKASGMTYTILRPSYFMEAWLGPAIGFDYAHHVATIYGPGENKISWIAIKDVAEYAVESVGNPAANSVTVELGGPEALSPHEAVQVFEREFGTTFELNHVPLGALEAQRLNATDPLTESFASLMMNYARGDVVDMTAASSIYPFKPSSVEEYAHRVHV